MDKKLKIRDLTLHNALTASAPSPLRREDLSVLLEPYREAGFHIVKLPLGALWDFPLASERSILEIPSVPDSVSEVFYRDAIGEGIGMIRVSDPQNDNARLRDAVHIISELGAVPDMTLGYLVDPEAGPLPPPKKKGFFARLFGPDEEETPEPEKIYTDGYFMEKAKEMEATGARVLSFRDEEGILTSSRVFTLMPKLKQTVKVPVAFHSAAPQGRALASTLTAIIKGADIVDTCVWRCSEGLNPPAIELIWIFCAKLGIDSDVDMEGVEKIRRTIEHITGTRADRGELPGCVKNDFKELHASIPPEIDAEFDRAIETAGVNDEEALLEACRRIESYFGFHTGR